MSLQRAYINCNRCFEIARFGEYRTRKKTYSDSISRDSSLWEARNEAMKALEEQIVNWRVYRTGDSHAIEAKKMLDVCMNCDYSKPKIKEIVTKFLKDKQK